MIWLRPILRAEAAEGDAGAAPAQPPATANDGGPTEEHKSRTAGELKAFIAAQRAAQAADDAPEPAPAAAPEPAKEGNEAAIEAAPTEEAEKAAKELDDAGKKVPKQGKGESDEKYTLKLAKMAQDLRDLEGRERRERTGREAAEKKAAELEAGAKKLEQLLARGKNPEDALEFILDTTGLTLEDIIKGINDNKIRLPRARAALPPDVAAALEEDRKERQRLADQLKEMQDKEAEREQERAQAAQAQQFKEHVGQTKKWLEENAEDFPLAAAIDWAPGSVVQGAYARKSPDLVAPTRDLEEALATNTLALLGNERALKALAKREPELTKKLASALGWSQAAPPAPSNTQAPPKKEQRPVGRTSTEAPTPKNMDDLPWEDRKAHVAAGLAQRIREMREQQ